MPKTDKEGKVTWNNLSREIITRGQAQGPAPGEEQPHASVRAQG